MTRADDGVFSMFFEDESPRISYVQGPSLFVTGIIIDAVHEIYPQVVKTSDLFGWIFDLFRENPSKFSGRESRRRLLRHLFELLLEEDVLPNQLFDVRLRIFDPMSLDYLAWACAFVWAGLRGGFHYRMTMEDLGLRSDSAAGLLLSLRETFLDLEEGPEECYEEQRSDTDFNDSLAPSSWLQDLVDCEATEDVSKNPRLAYYCRQIVDEVNTFVLCLGSLEHCS